MNILEIRVFNKLINFFESIGANIGLDAICYIIFGIFIIALISTFAMAANSYEVKLIKAIDRLNKYFLQNPSINEDNLVAFNEKMKKVPKVLRKQWQQFMLYRENDASYYMSYKNCIENPIKTSTYKQQIKTLNVSSYCLAFLGFFMVLSKTYIDGVTDVVEVLIRTLMIPLIILLINWIVSIFMTLRINAITGDLFQDFQYFQSNMDKATRTIPEYVDYEVLFTKKEIKQGIPVLFEYLEKRALIEQEELERARMKNAEHDKYNFEKLNVEASLVLERAMHEAETYLSNRNRLVEETEQINSEITNIQNDYRQATKEYQRKMQASKENLERLKLQMEQATSNIAANYIKKQQADEMSRQQNLEREFDNVTARHKKDMQNLQAEIEKREKEIDKTRVLLETAMMSEFDTYSKKVYDKVDVAVREKQDGRLKNLEKQLSSVQETSSAQKDELENIYTQYQMQTEKLTARIKELETKLAEKDYLLGEIKQAGKFSKKDKKILNITDDKLPDDFNFNNKKDKIEIDNIQADDSQEFDFNKPDEASDLKTDNDIKTDFAFDNETAKELNEDKETKLEFEDETDPFPTFEKKDKFEFSDDSKFDLSNKKTDEKFTFEEDDSLLKKAIDSKQSNDHSITDGLEGEPANEMADSKLKNLNAFKFDDDTDDDKGASVIDETLKSESDEQQKTIAPISEQTDDDNKSVNTENKKSAPMHVIDYEYLFEDAKEEPQKRPGRPKKEDGEGETKKPSGRKPGRPKKDTSEVKAKVPGKRGRPKKERDENETDVPIVKKSRGRPKKTDI